MSGIDKGAPSARSTCASLPSPRPASTRASTWGCHERSTRGARVWSLRWHRDRIQTACVRGEVQRQGLQGMPKHASLAERFAEKYAIDPDTGCYEWTGAVQSKGYGSFGVGNRKTVLAHRWALETFAGLVIPPEMTADHVCNNHRCVNWLVPHAGFVRLNPGVVVHGHFRIVTRRVNTLADHSDSPAAVNARRTHCVHGHELTTENCYVRRDGHRECRACAITRSAKRWRTHKNALDAP